MEYNNLYKETKSKKVQGTGGKKEKAEKELRCVYAYNDGGNGRNRVQGMRGRGVRNDCDTGCGMTVIRGYGMNGNTVCRGRNGRDAR
jgi:hypothetical protein